MKKAFVVLIFVVIIAALVYAFADSQNLGGVFRTATPTVTNTATFTSTSTVTNTSTSTPTLTATPTFTNTPTYTPSPTATNTPVPPTEKPKGNDDGNSDSNDGGGCDPISGCGGGTH